MAPGRIRPSSKPYRSTMDWCEQTQTLTIISPLEGRLVQCALLHSLLFITFSRIIRCQLLFPEHTVNRKGCGNHFPGFIISVAWNLHSLIAKHLFTMCFLLCIQSLHNQRSAKYFILTAERAYKTIFHHVSYLFSFDN